MAYTYEQLTKAYTAVHGVEPTGEAASQLRLLTNVSYTDTQRLSYILNSADQSTSVAVLSYQFFTGKAPSAEGMDYLLKSGATNLNSETYAKFNLENRFMNFATNLALQGEGKAAFEANYGSMTYAQYVASIYESIIGKAQATAAGLNPEQTILDIIARQDLILQSARNNGVIGPNATAAEIDLALKAATAAYLLAEGIKADVGIYAGATNNFMLGIAAGKAAYGTDILTTHAPTPGSGSTGVGQTIDNPPTDLPGAPEPEPEQPQPPQTSFTLTTGSDKFTGGATADTFTGTDLTYGSNDVLDGGAGVDTLTITASPTAGHAYDMPNDGFTGIEVVNVTSDGGLTAYLQNLADITDLNVTAGAGPLELDVNATAKVTATVTDQGGFDLNIDGGDDINVTSTGATIGRIVVGAGGAPTGDVVVSREQTGASLGGGIEVTGGKTVSITQTAIDPSNGATQRNGVVIVNGSALTTEVTVKAAQVATGAFTRNASSVSIIDADALNGTITKVSVDSYTTTAFTGSNLSDLSLAHGSSAVMILNGASATAAQVLDLKVNGLTGGALSDNGVYHTLNVTTGAEASTLANITFGALTDLTLAGASNLNLTSAAGLTHLETLTISGAAGLTATLSSNSVLTSIDASATTGDNTLTIDASKASFAGGEGADNITLSSSTVSQSITLGDGDNILTLVSGTRDNSITGLIEGGSGGNNTLKLEALDASQISNSGASKFYGFQTIELTDAYEVDHTMPIDLGMLSSVADTVRVQDGTGLRLMNATNLQSLELTGAGTSYTLSGNWSGGNDSLAVTLQGAGGGVNFAQTGVTAVGIETVNITSNDINQNGNAQNWLTWLGNDVTTIVASGDGDLNLTASSTALTTVDASGLTVGDFQWSSVGLTGAAVIKGSATGTNTIDLRSLGATGSFTYTGGTGADHIRFGVGANTISLVSDSAVDKIIVEGANTAAAYTTINGLQAGDQIVFSAFGGVPTPTALVERTGYATLSDYLANGASSTDGAAAYVEFVVIGSDSYLLYDRSTVGGFQDGTDVLIKLTGVTSLGTLTGGVYTP